MRWLLCLMNLELVLHFGIRFSCFIWRGLEETMVSELCVNVWFWLFFGVFGSIKMYTLVKGNFCPWICFRIGIQGNFNLLAPLGAFSILSCPLLFSYFRFGRFLILPQVQLYLLLFCLIKFHYYKGKKTAWPYKLRVKFYLVQGPKQE